MAVLRVTDQLLRYPVTLVHRLNEPSAPGGRAFLSVLADTARAPGGT